MYFSQHLCQMAVKICLVVGQWMLVVYNHNFSTNMETNLLWNIFDLLTNKAFIQWDEIIGILEINQAAFTELRAPVKHSLCNFVA